ncbi:MAG: helicase-associated domain-containing protein [Chloroflexi bacterium]|nr:helicase-associated domain-containing protein [Chloroflexota bacterium]
MPTLLASLLKHDIGHLRIVAGLWGLELESNETDSAREELSASLLDLELAGEILETLSPTIRAALDALITKDGRIPWAEFTRKFGDIREMGAGKRDRERPHLRPASTAEALFYRGFLARAFFDTPNGAQEFAYIPDDLLALISRRDTEPQRENATASLRDSVADEALGRPASPGERGQEILASDHILDDAATLLAALRMGRSDWQSDLRLTELLAAAKLIKKNIPQADAVRKFLEVPRDEALHLLTDAWTESNTFNELRQAPNLICEGEWTNQPQETREFLLNLLDAIPEGKWWSLSAFIRDVKQKYADFQRPAGDYDSWFIKRASDGQFLRGFAYWDEVDGALIRYFITNILHWLGQVDLAFAEGSSVPTSFRIAISDSRKSSIEKEKLHIASNGKITAPRFTPRVVRYQLARFCEWDEEKADEYHYHVTPHSLTKAKEQGLKVEHLLALLAKHSDAGIPPVFVKALKRWEVSGTEARVETQVVLRVSRPEVLEEMRKSKAAKYLGEILGPTTVVVKSGAIQKVMEALTELGLLAEVESRKDER